MGIDFQHISYLSLNARNGLSNLKSIAAEKVRLESQVKELKRDDKNPWLTCHMN